MRHEIARQKGKSSPDHDIIRSMASCPIPKESHSPSTKSTSTSPLANCNTNLHSVSTVTFPLNTEENIPSSAIIVGAPITTNGDYHSLVTPYAMYNEDWTMKNVD